MRKHFYFKCGILKEKRTMVWNNSIISSLFGPIKVCSFQHQFCATNIYSSGPRSLTITTHHPIKMRLCTNSYYTFSSCLLKTATSLPLQLEIIHPAAVQGS